jgi:hypothetical protein
MRIPVGMPAPLLTTPPSRHLTRGAMVELLIQCDAVSPRLSAGDRFTHGVRVGHMIVRMQ